MQETKITIIDKLRPLRVNVAKRARKIKRFYIQETNLNHTLYTKDIISQLKLLNESSFNFGGMKLISQITGEMKKAVDLLCESYYSNSIVLTAALRSSGLESNDSTMWVIGLFRVPIIDFEKEILLGYDYKIACASKTGKEPQLGQFAKQALIGGMYIVNTLNQIKVSNENIFVKHKFTVVTNSQNNFSLVTTNELTKLHLEEYKSVQNRELHHKLYLGHKISNISFGYISNAKFNTLLQQLNLL